MTFSDRSTTKEAEDLKAFSLDPQTDIHAGKYQPLGQLASSPREVMLDLFRFS